MSTRDRSPKRAQSAATNRQAPAKQSDAELLVSAYVSAGLVSDQERVIARRLMRVGECEDPSVFLAICLALRAPRLGHVCVDLSKPISQEAGTYEAQTESSLQQPPFKPWREALLQSTLVRIPSSEQSSPFVLDDAQLYCDRYYRYELRLAQALMQRACVEVEVDATALRDALDLAFGPTAADPERLDRQRLAAAAAQLRRLCVIVGGPGTGKTTTVRKLLLTRFALARSQGQSAPRVALAAPTGKAASRLRASLLENKEEVSADAANAPDHDALEQLPARTLHRLLQREPGNETRFRYGTRLPLPYDLVVVDEASMIDLAMMTKLVEAVGPGCTLVLLGDPDQLASVEAGAVLGELCSDRNGELRMRPSFARQLSALMPDLRSGGEDRLSARAQLAAEPDALFALDDCIHELTQVHRFRADSALGQVAKLLQQSDGPQSAFALLTQHTPTEAIDPAGEGLAWLPDALVGPSRPHAPLGDQDRLLRKLIVDAYRPALALALAPVTQLASGKVQQAQNADAGTDVGGPNEQLDDALRQHAIASLSAFEAIRVLCAHTQGPRGVEGLDRRITAWLDEAIADFSPGPTLYPGQPILVTQNDPSVGLYNGDVGLCLRHPLDPTRVRVVFWSEDANEGVRFVSPTRLPAHQSVFAMSIHKSQGSQFQHVVVVLPHERSPICTHELVYTALTRARRGATIVASDSVLRESLAARVQRHGGLGRRLRAR